MDTEELARRRMTAVGLAGPDWPGPVEVVRRFGAVQAQEFGPALWSLRQRTGAGDEPGMLAAFDAGDFLRTHVLRPTWHLVHRADIRWMLALTAPRVHLFNRHYYRKNELDEADLRKCHDIVAGALTAHGPMTRAELAAALEGAGVVASGLRLGLILMHAELEQLICSGPRRGKQQTYVLLDDLVPPEEPVDIDAAAAELALRYFTSHGPATVKDFAWWSSLTVTQCRRAIEAAKDGLESATIDEMTYWSGVPAPVIGEPKRAVQLLQPYDEYMVAYRESTYVSDRADFGPLRPERGAYIGLLIRDSQLAGFWKRTVTAARVTIHVQLYEPFDADDMRDLRAAADEHAAFLGRSADVAEPESLLSW